MTKDTHTSNKTTNIVAGGLVFSCLIGFFLQYNNIRPEIFLVFTVLLVRQQLLKSYITTIINEALFRASLQLTV